MILKVIFANSLDPDQTAPVCKNRFEKFERIFSRRHNQTTFSDAGLLGALRVNESKGLSWLKFNESNDTIMNL